MSWNLKIYLKFAKKSLPQITALSTHSSNIDHFQRRYPYFVLWSTFIVHIRLRLSFEVRPISTRIEYIKWIQHAQCLSQHNNIQTTENRQMSSNYILVYHCYALTIQFRHSSTQLNSRNVLNTTNIVSNLIHSSLALCLFARYLSLCTDALHTQLSATHTYAHAHILCLFPPSTIPVISRFDFDLLTHCLLLLYLHTVQILQAKTDETKKKTFLPRNEVVKLYLVWDGSKWEQSPSDQLGK